MPSRSLGSAVTTIVAAVAFCALVFPAIAHADSSQDDNITYRGSSPVAAYGPGNMNVPVPKAAPGPEAAPEPEGRETVAPAQAEGAAYRGSSPVAAYGPGNMNAPVSNVAPDPGAATESGAAYRGSSPVAAYGPGNMNAPVPKTAPEPDTAVPGTPEASQPVSEASYLGSSPVAAYGPGNMNAPVPNVAPDPGAATESGAAYLGSSPVAAYGPGNMNVPVQKAAPGPEATPEPEGREAVSPAQAEGTAYLGSSPVAAYGPGNMNAPVPKVASTIEAAPDPEDQEAEAQARAEGAAYRGSSPVAAYGPGNMNAPVPNVAPNPGSVAEAGAAYLGSSPVAAYGPGNMNAQTPKSTPSEPKDTDEEADTEIIITETVVVTIAGSSAEAVYDGEEKAVEGYEVVGISNELYTAEDFEFAGEAAARGTDAGSYPMGLSPDDFANVNASFADVEFDVVDGSLEIARRSVTLTSPDASKEYDGEALVREEVAVGGDGFAPGEGASFDVTGQITSAGEVPNTFTYSLDEGTDAGNYDISTAEGTLSVAPMSQTVVVTIAGSSAEAVYDGEEKAVEGYEVVGISNELYTAEDFEFAGEAAARGTDAGSYPMGLSPDDFANVNASFADVEFDVADGSLEIVPAEVTVIPDDLIKAFCEGDPELTANVEGLIGNDAIEFELTRAEGEDVGDYAISSNGEATQGNYVITFSTGTLSIVVGGQPDIVVTDDTDGTVFSGSRSKVYDGMPLSATAAASYTAENGTAADIPVLYSADGGNTWSTDAVSITDVGSVDVLVRSDSANVTEASASFTIEVAPRPFSAIPDAVGVVYDGTEHAIAVSVDDATATDDSGIVSGETLTVSPLAVVSGTSVGTYSGDFSDNDETTYWSVTKADGSDSTGNYTANITAQLVIEAADIAEAAVSADDQVYTGEALTPAVSVGLGAAALEEGVDFTAEYADNVNAGTAAVTVTGQGNYAGTAAGTFDIAPAQLSEAAVSADDQVYTGEALTPAVSVGLGAAALEEGVDFTAEYADNVDAGTAAVTVTGRGNYAGTAAGTFDIAPAQLSEAAVSADDQVYTGEALTPAVSVGLGAAALEEGVDFTAEYADNVDAGTAAVTVTGRGNYAGTAAGTFDIAPASISAATVAVEDQAYTGKARTPAVKVQIDSVALESGIDYTVAYKNNVAPGTATVSVSGNGNYTGTKNVSFKIRRFDFADVDSSNWFYDWVLSAAGPGIMTGYAGPDEATSSFGPEDYVTRAQAATILWRAAGSPKTPYSETFGDVPNGVYYAEAVLWCCDNGIMSGYEGVGLFGPDDYITREQIGTMLWRYARYCGADVSASPQAFNACRGTSSVSGYAKGAMVWCTDRGIIEGVDIDGVAYLQPQEYATRAQMAKIITVAMQDALDW